jgi:hypothetical protein
MTVLTIIGVIAILFVIVLASCKWDFGKAFVVIIEAVTDIFD